MSTVAEPCSCTPRDRNSAGMAGEPAAQASRSARSTAAGLNLDMENYPENQCNYGTVQTTATYSTILDRGGRSARAETSIAQPLDLQVVCIGGKAGGLDPLSQQSGDGRVAEFSHCAAGAADQKLSGVQMLRCLAAQIGVQSVDTVDESRTHQKAQSAVHRLRRVLTALLAQLTQNAVDPHRPFAGPNELEHPLAGGGQSQAALGAHLVGRAQRFGHAALVIVLATRLCKAACR